MKPMSITEWLLGLILSSAISFYWWHKAFLPFTRYTAWELYLNVGAIIGIMFMFLWVVRSGEKTHLTCFHKETGKYCRPGIYFLPNALPITREIELILGFGVAVTERNAILREDRDTNRHYHDQKLPQLIHRVETTSFFKAQVANLSARILAWLFTFKGKDGAVEFYRVGRLILIVVYIAAFVGNIFFPKYERSEFSLPFSLPSSIPFSVPFLSKEDSPEKLVVKVQLRRSPLPKYPPPELFEIRTEPGVWLYEDIEGVPFFYYPSPRKPGNIPQVTFRSRLCSVVPAGLILYHRTDLRPTVVVNMTKTVTYLRKADTGYDGYFPRLLFLILNFRYYQSTPFLEVTTWNNLYENWHLMANEGYMILEALPTEKLRDGQRGGFVCYL